MRRIRPSRRQLPATWRTTKTVAKPATMKEDVADSERGDRRDRPQTPWPLVHPPAMRVPTPTSNPATTSTGNPASMVIVGYAATIP